ncbi:MAG: hypothetical protein HYY01_09010 [Chloroflexi bacterium]|nr:hypothetical protein [Chloroflexota bacterium]
MTDNEIVAKLNELLEAERAGVPLLSVLADRQPPGFIRNELEKIGKDEAAACVGLVKAIRRQGGTPSGASNDFAGKVLALPSEAEQLSLLARGQAWVVKRIDALLSLELDTESAAFLRDMRVSHQDNIAWCNSRVESLQASTL